VSDKTPHMTLLYGFLTEAKTLQPYIEKVLEGWNLPSVKIADISFFNSPYEDAPYYCIIAKIEVSDELLEGHRRLEFLPHINTFTGYTPHITIAYIIKDEAIRDDFIAHLKKEWLGKELKITGLNYGGNK
ncbi:MAG: 2'-5' RNA ligase family protein, partial [Nanoarchaeota archaeon]